MVGLMDQTDPLKDLFPDLFILCTNSEAMLSDCWTEQGCNLYFKRPLNYREIERVAKFLEETEDLQAPILPKMQ